VPDAPRWPRVSDEELVRPERGVGNTTPLTPVGQARGPFRFPPVQPIRGVRDSPSPHL
jgi:hypothetical protein